MILASFSRGYYFLIEKTETLCLSEGEFLID
jgi:hypothetical protein